MKKAFTLSEALITLVVLGIVAAMTIPVVIGSVMDHDNKSRAKKLYANLSNAMEFVYLKGGSTAFVAYNDSDANMKQWFDKYLKNYLNTIKVCYDTKGCWNEGHTYNYNGSEAYYSRKGKGVGANVITAILADGSFINIDAYGKASIANYFGLDITGNNALVVIFDVNGAKKPNKFGKDVFATVFDNESLVPAYRDRTQEQIDNDCSRSGTGYSCLRKIVTESAIK